MKVYLTRHGETTGDVEDRFGGDYDDHLTDKGKQQSQELAGKLKGKGIKAVFHSSRHRATETAKILAKELDVVMIKIDGLRERNNYGIMTGMLKSEAREKYPEEVAKIKHYEHDIPDTEAYGPFKERVISALKECLSHQMYDSIAIVTHGGPIKCIVREVLKLGELKHLGDCAYIQLEKRTHELIWIDADGAELDR